MQNRELAFDVIKTIAIVWVVWIHVTWNFLSAWLLSWDELVLAEILRSVFAAIPLFVMVTWALLLPREMIWWSQAKQFVIKRIWNILPALIFRSLFFVILKLAVWAWSMQDILPQLYSGTPNVHLWYLYMLVWLYIIHPLLRRIVQKYWVAVLAFLWIIVFAINFWESLYLKSNNIIRTVQDTFFLVKTFNLLWYYIRWYVIYTHKEVIKKYSLRWMLWATLSYIWLLLSKLWYFYIWSIWWYIPFSITYALFLFATLISLSHKIKSLPSWISSISCMTLGIYIIHPMVLQLYMKWQLALSNSSFWMILSEFIPYRIYLFIAFIIVFGISLMLIIWAKKIQYMRIVF